MKLLKTFILASALTASFASCDMDKYPYDAIPVDNAIQTLSDCEKLRNGMYRDLRIISFATNSLASDFQADQFIPASYWGNQYGSQYRWEATAADGSFSTVYNNGYVTIAQCNMLIAGCQQLLNRNNLNATDEAAAKNFLGEAYLVRAFAYEMLAERFCALYNQESAASTMGLSLVTEYKPSADNSTFPGRSNLADTYARIKEDIRLAQENLKAAGKQDNPYLSVDALKAFEARVALLTGDYDTAISNAEALINSNAYPLIKDQQQFNSMWLNDQSTEVICQLHADKQELAFGMGSSFLDEIMHKPYFFPSLDIVNLYGENDIRLNAFFAMDNIAFETNDKEDMVVFYKYPGNPALYEGSNNYVNKPKLFRIAEQYLIAAEAYYLKGGVNNEEKAYNWIYKLMSARDKDVKNNKLTGTALRNLIRDERQRELVGEGFRLNDLKRYGEGFTRQKAQKENRSYQLALNLTIQADNFRWIWAIPKDEMDANPQLKGQQNPGY